MFRSLLDRFLKEEDGQDLVEYSIFLALMGLAAVAALATLKASLSTLWANYHCGRSKAGR